MQVSSNDIRPQAPTGEVADQVGTDKWIIPGARAHDNGITVNEAISRARRMRNGLEVPRIWLKTLKVAKQLRRGRSWHESGNDRVPEAEPSDSRSQAGEIMSIGRRNSPHVNLQQPTRSRRSGPIRISPIRLSQATASIQRCVIYSLEYGDIQLASAERGVWQMELHEDIGQPLDTYTKGASTTSRGCNVRDRIVRHVNAPVRVGDDHANNVFEPLEVERAIVINADRQGN